MRSTSRVASETLPVERAIHEAILGPAAGPGVAAPEPQGPADALAPLAPVDTFVRRHLGPSEADVREMLSVLGLSSLAELVDETVPASIRLSRPLALPGLPDRLLG